MQIPAHLRFGFAIGFESFYALSEAPHELTRSHREISFLQILTTFLQLTALSISVAIRYASPVDECARLAAAKWATDVYGEEPHREQAAKARC